VRRVRIDSGTETIGTGDPVQVEDGAAMAYVAGDGVFGIALYGFDSDDHVANSTKDQPQANYPLIYPAREDSVYRVQAKKVVSEEDLAVNADVLGNTYNLAGTAGEMYLDVSAAGDDFYVLDIEDTVSDWGDSYPVLLVKIANPQDVDPTL
jgi:hypothetical protein